MVKYCWKNRYAELKPGDMVLMISPCTDCSSRTTVEKRKKCWEESFKGCICIINHLDANPTRAGFIYNISNQTGNSIDRCNVPKECLRKVE